MFNASQPLDLTAMANVLIVMLTPAIGILAFALTRQHSAIKRITGELKNRPAGGSARVTVTSRARCIVELATSINNALDAEEAERESDHQARRKFNEDLAALSHDIRTPLAGALGYLVLCQDTSNANELNQNLAHAKERLEAIRCLADDLFDYTKCLSIIERPPIEKIGVFSTVAKALISQYPLFTERSWEPKVDFDDENVLIAAPAGYFDRICANLTINCLRHGTMPPLIEFHEAKLSYRNEIKDPRAINPSRLFDRFYRADSARTGDGSGLGLAIVAQLCHDMDVPIAARIEGNDLVIEMNLDSIIIRESA